MVGRPSYRALRAFVETVNTGSAAAAGRRLGVSASAVSHLIRELERQLGSRLFVAGPKSGLTEAGRRLQQSIGVSFIAIDRALSDFDGLGPEIRLSTVATFANLWLLPRLASFTAQHPGLRLTISSNRRVVTVGADPFDCSIRWGRGEWREANSYLLFRERLVLVGKEPLQPGEDPLSKPRISALTRPDDWPAYLAAVGGAEARPRLVVEDRATAVEAVGSGLGVTIIDQSLAAHSIATGRIVQLAPGVCQLDDGFYFVAGSPGNSNDPVEQFRRWLTGSLRKDASACGSTAGASIG